MDDDAAGELKIGVYFKSDSALKLDVVAVSPLDDWAADWSVAAPAA